jgi:hypothetical protein
MKRLLILLLLAPIILTAQDATLLSPFPISEGKVKYEKIIEVPGATKEVLYGRTKAWALAFYNSQKDVLQLDDKEAGVIAYKGFFSQSYVSPKMYGFNVPSTFQYWETIKIFLKDGKAKIVITDISVRQKVHASTAASTYGEEIQFEKYLYNLKNPDTDAIKGIGKKKMEQYMKEDSEKRLEQMPSVDLQFKAIIASIEDFLTGKKVSDSDF